MCRLTQIELDQTAVLSEQAVWVNADYIRLVKQHSERSEFGVVCLDDQSSITTKESMDEIIDKLCGPELDWEPAKPTVTTINIPYDQNKRPTVKTREMTDEEIKESVNRYGPKAGGPLLPERA